MSETGYDALMHVACVGWGFCGGTKHGQLLHVDHIIPPDGPVHARQFAEWLLLADNMNPNKPEYDRHKAALTAAFITHMGSEVVDASLLRWSAVEPDAAEPNVKFHGYIADDPAEASDDS